MFSNTSTFCINNLFIFYNDQFQISDINYSKNWKNIFQIREKYQEQINYQREYTHWKILSKQWQIRQKNNG